jgi:hypothetical protein
LINSSDGRSELAPPDLTTMGNHALTNMHQKEKDDAKSSTEDR